MHTERQLTTFTYKIEPNPGGGFIARSPDPAVPSLEAPTREELQQLINKRIAETLASQMGGFGIPIGNKGKLSVQLLPGAAKLGASFDLHFGAGDDAASASPEQVKNLTEEIAGIVSKDFPELATALKSQPSALNSNTKSSVDVSIKTRAVSTNLWTLQKSAPANGSDQPKLLDEAGNVLNTPIVPEVSGAGKLLKLIVTLMMMVGLIYLLFLRHR